MSTLVPIPIIPCGTIEDCITMIGGRIFLVAAVLAVVIGVIFFLLGPLLRSIETIAGKSDEEQFKRFIIGPIIGIVLVFLAFIIVNVIVKALKTITGAS